MEEQKKQKFMFPWKKKKDRIILDFFVLASLLHSKHILAEELSNIHTALKELCNECCFLPYGRKEDVGGKQEYYFI